MTPPITDYRKGDTVYVLLTERQAESVMLDWLEHRRETPLTVERSRKTPGHVVVMTTDTLWASHILKWHNYERATIKRKDRQ